MGSTQDSPEPVRRLVRGTEEKGGSRILVVTMVALMVIAFLCLIAAFVVQELPRSRFQIDRPWFDIAFSGFTGLFTLFAAASLLMKLVIQLTRRW